MRTNRMLIVALTLLAGLTRATDQDAAQANIQAAIVRRDVERAYIDEAFAEFLDRLRVHRELGQILESQPTAVKLQCQPHFDQMFEAILSTESKIGLAEHDYDRGLCHLIGAQDMYSLGEYAEAYWLARRSIWDGFTPSHGHALMSWHYWPVFDVAHQSVLTILGL